MDKREPGFYPFEDSFNPYIGMTLSSVRKGCHCPDAPKIFWIQFKDIPFSSETNKMLLNFYCFGDSDGQVLFKCFDLFVEEM